jgi:cyclomaltodextrinase / maltogenic alpha-amylase / neopullulanase
MSMSQKYLIILIAFFSSAIFPAEIIINKKDAVVWSRDQIIKGEISNTINTNGTLFLNNSPISFQIISGDSFSIPITINEGLNTIYIEVDSSGTIFRSDTLQLTLGYKLKPEIYAYAEVNGRDVTLFSEIIENPDSSLLAYLWQQDQNNPSQVSLSNEHNASANFNVPSDAPAGEYYFDLITIASDGDTVIARTYITVSENIVEAFNIKTDHAEWINSAIIYEITPYIFVQNGKFNQITAKIPEIVELGINTIWLQPIYSTYYRGQGYDVIDYFNIRSDLGTEADLQNLINTARSYGLKVMFDFVPSHSSIKHPYAENSLDYGEDSHYWHYYMREADDAPYSQHYRYYMGFMNYFWDNLPMLNVGNPEVRKWLTEAAKYWVEKFDIDGYRFDAVWGVTARYPQFTKDLRLALKRIKPELLLLAEDKATQEQVFDERFDVAYDWAPGLSWVSQWVWQTTYNANANPTIFNNGSQNQRSNLLRSAMTNGGNGYAPNAKILRMLDNNDHFYFITHHGIERTRMAAALTFSLQGVPLMYNGQESGKTGHPYSTEFIFYPGQPIDYTDSHGLFLYYQRLIELRKNLPALYSDNYSEISVSPSSYVFGFRRWENDQNVFAVLNMGSSSANVTMNIPIEEMNLDSTKTYYLTDMINGDVVSGTVSELASVNIPFERYTTRMFLFADSIMSVTGIEEFADAVVLEEFELFQNYPNPFNPTTRIKFSVPLTDKGSSVQLKIFDILGNEVAALVNEQKAPGEYYVEFNASRLSAGVYFYRLQMGEKSLTKKMMLLK